MKRCWLGFGLLLVLLVLSLAATGFMTRIHESMALELEQSAECALLGDWDNTELFFRLAQRNWSKWEHLRACFADHEPAEEIDASLEALKVYCQARDAVTYRAACAALVCQVRAMGEAHQAVWWNLL